MGTRTAFSEDHDPATSCMLCNGYLEPMGYLGRHMWYRCRCCGDTSSVAEPTDSCDVGFDDIEYSDYDEDD